MNFINDLQRRFPWAGGYSVAPLTFFLARHSSDALLAPRTPLKPLLASVGETTPLVRSLLTFAFVFHFVRRLVEVFFVNDYQGTFERDSKLEFVYYAIWGLLGGCAVGQAAMDRNGAVSTILVALGFGIFLCGELGNSWAHWYLRSIRAAKKAVGTSKYVIPTGPFFAAISCPHYTFEMLSWIGYAILSGVDSTSVTFLVLSIVFMAPFANDRHNKYVQMQKDGNWDGVGTPPDEKWKMIPFVW